MAEEKQRIDINDLPRAQEELTDDEEKNVTGGVGGLNVVLGDGSVRNTVGGSPGANKGITIGGSRTDDV